MKANRKVQPQQVAFDMVLATDIAERLAMGLHPDIIALQLSNRASPEVVRAYAANAEQNPYFKAAQNIAKAVRKRDWILDCQSANWREGPQARGVPRRHRLSAEEFLRDYLAPQLPVIISGLIDDWPALNVWDADYLERKVGRETEVEVQKGRSTRRDYETAKLDLKRRVPFGEVTDLLRSGVATNDMYVTANNGSENRAAFDPLWGDFGPIPGYTAEEPGNDGYLWIGPKGTVTPFHHDLTNNLLVQVRGRKSAHLVPPWEEARMKQFGRFFSGWTLEDMQKAGKDAPCLLEVEMTPGDMLFIPVGWWHHVVSLDESYSILFTNTAWPNRFGNSYMA